LTFASIASSESSLTIHQWTKDSADYPCELLDLAHAPSPLFSIGDP